MDFRHFEPQSESDLRDAVESMSGDESRLRRLLKSISWQASALWRMVACYARREYTSIPWASAAAACGAIAYVLAPIDALPDFLPGIGMLDDAVVVSAVVSALSVDIARFLAWERQQAAK